MKYQHLCKRESFELNLMSDLVWSVSAVFQALSFSGSFPFRFNSQSYIFQPKLIGVMKWLKRLLPIKCLTNIHLYLTFLVAKFPIRLFHPFSNHQKGGSDLLAYAEASSLLSYSHMMSDISVIYSKHDFKRHSSLSDHVWRPCSYVFWIKCQPLPCLWIVW